MIKRLLAVLLLCASACATTTITGNIKNLGTSTVSLGTFVRFYLRGCAGNQPRINGTALIAPTFGNIYFIDFVPSSSGVISGTVYSTTDITGLLGGDIECGGLKTGLWYGMTPFLNGRAGPETAIAAKNNTTIDISNITPLTANPVVTAPTGDTTYARLDGGNMPFTGAVTVPSLNSIQFADQFTGADGGQKINAAIAACPAAGCTIFAQGLGAHTWSTNVFPGNKAIDIYLPAATITLTAVQTMPENVNIHCVPSTDTTHGTTFSGTINTGSWFTWTDLFTGTMDGCSFVKTGTAGGTLFTVIGSKFVRLRNFQNINGNWNDILLLNSDSVGSAIYNDFEDWFATGFVNNLIHINSTGGATKVVTSNYFRNMVELGISGNTCILMDAAATSSIGENIFDGSDCTGGTSGLNIATSQARDNQFRGHFFENASGTGVNIASGAINTTFIGTQVTGNGTNFTDAGSNTVVIGNVAGVARQWSVSPAGDTNFNSIGIGAAGSGNPGGINMAINNTIEAGGVNSIQFLSGGEALFLKFNGWNETTAPAGSAAEDRVYGDSTLHGRMTNPNNTGWVPTGSRAILTADWTCGTGGTVSTCAAATIIGSGGGVAWTFNLPLVANSLQLDCDGVVAQTTAATVNQWNLITATNGATNVTAYYAFPVNGATAPTLASNTYTTDQTSTTSTFQIGGSWTLGALIGAAKYPFHIHAAVEAASASGTVLSVQLLAPTPADLVTIFRGSGCWIHP